VIERALLSVYDKTGLDAFVRGLAELGVELVASGGTAAFIQEHELGVTLVEELTGAGELLGGRVKTLHPQVHAAILARADNPEDAHALGELGIRPFQLVCVNLYPFAQIAWRRGVTEAEAVEMIDVGGPAMLRAAAKNHAHVAPVCRPEQYDAVLAELRADGALSPATRRRLAADAFATTAAYEAAIAAWFAEGDASPATMTPTLNKALDLAYGENPHQRAAFYVEAGARRHVLSRVEQIQGKELSFNNLADLSAARRLCEEFTVPACVIVKHANPCGVALGTTIDEAYARAHAADPVSAYGGVVVCNRPVDGAVAARLTEQFVEVLFAPGYDDDSRAALSVKPAMRVLLDSERRHHSPGERDYRRVMGGLLVQDSDSDVDPREAMEVACGDPTEDDWGELLFAWRVCKHVLSNAIVIARDLQTVGIGAGQTSRVDAVRIAVERADDLGHGCAGAVLASDAFFPFADGPQLALEAGVRAIIQPGGSKRDEEVIEAVKAAGATMVLTHRRHFRH
jgi:phosphoribosylaminoimidazolecarboxamide formyltransferase / IMP cyclohydrolase